MKENTFESREESLIKKIMKALSKPAKIDQKQLSKTVKFLRSLNIYDFMLLMKGMEIISREMQKLEIKK